MDTSNNQTAPTSPEQDLISTPKQGLLQKLSRKQKISLLFLTVLLIALPLTTALALIVTRINSRAYLPATPPISSPITPTTALTPTASPSANPTPSICKNPLKEFRSLLPCNLPTTTRQPRKSNERGIYSGTVICQNGYRETYRTGTCVTRVDFESAASNVCQKHASCSAPVINTSVLPNGTQNQRYSVSIAASDKDKYDKLTMEITGLPKGLVRGRCVNNANLSKISCGLSGTPAVSGFFTIQVTVKDNNGGIATKALSLTIAPPSKNTR